MACSPPRALSMGFSRQEYWSGLPFPSPEDLLEIVEWSVHLLTYGIYLITDLDRQLISGEKELGNLFDCVQLDITKSGLRRQEMTFSPGQC